MAKQKFSEAEIIAALKRSEAGLTYEQLGRELGVSKHTIAAWKAKYGGMNERSAATAATGRRERAFEETGGRTEFG